MTVLLAQVGNREGDITMNSAFVHVGSDQEDLKVKASSGQLDKWVWSPRQKT